MSSGVAGSPATPLLFPDRIEPMDPVPVVLIEPPGSARDRILAAALEAPVEVTDSVEGFFVQAGGTEEDWGIALLGPGLDAAEIFRLLEGQEGWTAPWSVFRVEERAGELMVRSLSLGPAQELAAVLAVAKDPAGKGPAMELNWILRVVAKARHDLNNPLTAGLAEVQLLLMDDHGSEVNESLNTIQQQFRRLRDMVAELSRMRAPRGPRSG